MNTRPQKSVTPAQRAWEAITNLWYALTFYRPVCLMCGKPIRNPARNDAYCPECESRFFVDPKDA